MFKITGKAPTPYLAYRPSLGKFLVPCYYRTQSSGGLYNQDITCFLLSYDLESHNQFCADAVGDDKMNITIFYQKRLGCKISWIKKNNLISWTVCIRCCYFLCNYFHIHALEYMCLHRCPVQYNELLEAHTETLAVCMIRSQRSRSRPAYSYRLHVHFFNNLKG